MIGDRCARCTGLALQALFSAQLQRLPQALTICDTVQSLFAYVPFTWRACSTSEWPLEPQDSDLSRSRTERGCYFCGAPLP